MKRKYKIKFFSVLVIFLISFGFLEGSVTKGKLRRLSNPSKGKEH